MGTARTDLSDLRFVDENNKEIPYWIEANLDDVAATITANGYVYVWVKVPLIMSTTATIKLLWGHPTALSKSNGALTFPFFDHFAGAAYDSTKWGYSTSAPSVSGSVMTVVHGSYKDVYGSRAGSRINVGGVISW